MERRKFTKVFLIVQGNNIFSEHKHKFINMYRERADAERICSQKQREVNEESKMYHAMNKPIPQYKVHGFYLVHESLV